MNLTIFLISLSLFISMKIQFPSLFFTMIKINFKFMCNLLMILLKYAENRVRKMWSKFGNWCTMSWLLYYIQNTFIQSKHSFVIIHEPLSIIQISSVIPIPSVYVVDWTYTLLTCTMKLKTYILYLFHIEKYSRIARK